MKLLIVDDEGDIAELIRFNLANEGYEVQTAANGETALTKVARFRPDLIVLDLMLPDIDGISLCEILRRSPETAETPILMLTAWSTVQSKLLGLEAGADDYMAKPFSPRELSLRIRKLLERAGHFPKAAVMFNQTGPKAG